MKKVFGDNNGNNESSINSVENEIADWICKMTSFYTENPPECLVYLTMQKYSSEGEKLSYEEAKERVEYKEILHYIQNEISQKYRFFEQTVPNKNIEELKTILALSFEKVEERLNNLPTQTTSDIPKKLLDLVQKEMVKQKVYDAGIGMINEEIIENGGTICDVCGHHKLTADGCACTTVICNGVKYERTCYGDENLTYEGKSCSDCATTLGHYHHPNCDIEVCPICGQQLIGCDCNVEYSM